MTDPEFQRAFEDTTLEPFRHRDHLRLTWIYLSQFGETGTLHRLGPSILRYAEARHAGHKYHETITVAWIRLLSQAFENNFDALLAKHPDFLDKKFLERFYSPDLLQSPEARAQWAEPDREPLRL